MLHIFIVDYFNQNSTGLTTYVNNLSLHLSIREEISLQLVLVNAKAHKSIEKSVEAELTKYFVPHDLARPLNMHLDTELAEYLQRESIGKENILFHFNWINHAPFAQVLKRKMNCRTVLTKHCMPWRDLVTGSGYPLFKRINHKLKGGKNQPYFDTALMKEWVSYYSVDHIICVTEFAHHALKKLFRLPDDKITVIQNGLDLKRSKHSSKFILREKYGFPRDEQIILYAGLLNERKGVFDLIQAFMSVASKIDKVRLVITGDGDFKQALSHAKGNWNRITFTGFLDKTTLYDFYQMGDVGVIPSYVEQCSYTAIEMMHHGLPIIVGDVDGLKELVPSEFGARVPLIFGKKGVSISKRKLTEAMLDALSNREKAATKAGRAKAYAIKNLSCQKMVDQTISIYQNVVYSGKQITQQVLHNDQNTQPLVSVVVPCRNAASYIKDCIDSVLKQNYTNFELIVIDDDSEDISYHLLKCYRDKRIVLLRNTKKQGIVRTLNSAIKHARGKYIARLDADDIMREDRLSRQVNFLEHKENQSIVIIGSNHYIINEAGIITGFKEYPKSMQEISNVMLFQNPFSHPSVMMRTEIFRELEYSTKYPLVEDYHLWFKILEKHQGANIPECLTYYRVHGNNVSNLEAKKQRESAADLLSDELEKREIDHSVNELTTHIAISQGLGNRFFNTEGKQTSLDKWIEKVLVTQKHRYTLTDPLLSNLKNHIKHHYCGQL